MANQQKQSYVSDLYAQLQQNPHFVLIGFEKTTHLRLEEFRNKLRENFKGSEDSSELMVIKNSLFKVALEKLQNSDEKLSVEDTKMIQDLAKGQTMLLLLPGEWTGALKTVHTFAKEEEGMIFRAGRIEGIVYQEGGLQSLAQLPTKDELAVKIINALRSSQTRLVYSLQYNTIKLVNVLKNAGEKGGAGAVEEVAEVVEVVAAEPAAAEPSESVEETVAEPTEAVENEVVAEEATPTVN